MNGQQVKQSIDSRKPIDRGILYIIIPTPVTVSVI